MKMIFYGDESGNTSNNYLDLDQPNYTYCGILIQEDTYESIVELVKNLKVKYCYSGELKSRILDTARGINFSEELFEKLFIEYRIVPFYFVASKRMMLSHLLTDFYFDSEYNLLLNTLSTSRSEFKINFSKLIINYNNLLSNMQLIIRSRLTDEELFNVVYELIIELHTILNELDIISMPTILEINELTREMFNQAKLIHNDRGYNLNSLAISGVLQTVSRFTFINEGETLVKLDNSKIYDEFFLIYKALSAEENKHFGLYSLENQFYHLNFCRLIDIKLVDSRDEPLIQIADLLNGLFKKSVLEENKNFNKIMSMIMHIEKLFKNAIECDLGIEMLNPEEKNINVLARYLKKEIIQFLK